MLWFSKHHWLRLDYIKLDDIPVLDALKEKLESVYDSTPSGKTSVLLCFGLANTECSNIAPSQSQITLSVSLRFQNLFLKEKLRIYVPPRTSKAGSGITTSPTSVHMSLDLLR
ncbi:hypothetical protein C5167_013004 [Papaver somniferum]|uniref:Uncharacterized protein n=1 Tax=Papaver somniferum TaxID=3469 RepID=A0A4Y7IZ43_PAPSO|nr:hypothetical protein C5167_013004 [Papaver somniferum]